MATPHSPARHQHTLLNHYDSLAGAKSLSVYVCVHVCRCACVCVYVCVCVCVCRQEHACSPSNNAKEEVLDMTMCL